MNIFRFAGDMSHVVSILVLLLRLRSSKSAVGISLKTQELYLIVFVARYADLFSHFYSLYNTFMKIAFITSTAAIIYTVRFRAPWKHKYDRSQDSFKHWLFAVLPCAVVSGPFILPAGLVTPNVFACYSRLEPDRTSTFLTH